MAVLLASDSLASAKLALLALMAKLAVSVTMA